MATSASLSLNCSDLPEAQYWNSKAKTRGRGKAVFGPLPLLAESNEDSDEDNVVGEDQAQTWWHCQACTFRNNELLPRCEVCNTEKDAKGGVHGVVKAPLVQLTLNQHWPALPEAWADCDVSSVASSWLDVGAANEQAGFDEDSDFDESDVVLVHDTSVQAVAKPVLWSAVVGRNAGMAPQCNVPVSAALMPPLSRRLGARAKAVNEDEETDAALDELDTRRMIGRHTRQFHTRKK